MIYKFFKQVGLIAFRVYFKRVFVAGIENFPKDKPVLLAVNHPNSVIDAMLCGCFLPKPAYSLARGDAFKSKGLVWFLTKLKIIPIYRQSEGDLDKNQDSFKRCNELLGQQKTVLIFPEGLCVSEKRLRTPLKKGIARIAFSTLESHASSDLVILPVGLNYSHFHQFRKEVMIQVGEPIAAKDYFEDYKKSPARAIKTLISELEQGMNDVNLIIENQEREELAEEMLSFYRSKLAYSPKWFRKHQFRFEDEKYILEKLNSESDEKLKFLSKQFNLMQEEFAEIKLSYERFNNSSKASFGGILLFLLLLPFGIIGHIFRFIPSAIAKTLVQKKVKEIEFHSTVFVAGAILSFLSFSILLLIAGLLFGSYGLGAFFIIMVSMMLSVYFDDLVVRLKNWYFWKRAKKKPSFRTTLDMYRGLNEFMDPYFPPTLRA